MTRSNRYSPEVRKRAVRMVLEHEREHSSQWSAIVSIAAKIGCTPETLRKWVRRTEVDILARSAWFDCLALTNLRCFSIYCSRAFIFV